MTDRELDQILDRWTVPTPPPALRRQVLGSWAPPARRGFIRPLQWAAALALASGMLTLGATQASPGLLDHFASVLHHFAGGSQSWVDQMYMAHVIAAYRHSNPKVYIDGELREDAEIGGSSGSMCVRVPGEGKYYLALHLRDFKGAYSPGRFDGHALEFDAGGRAVRIQSSATFGFGGRRDVFLLGPARAIR